MHKKGWILCFFLFILFVGIGILLLKEEPLPSVSPSAAPSTKASLSKEGNLSVTFIDVGQGDSILIQTPNQKTMLIDAGEKDSFAKIQSVLDANNIQKIDVLVATHPHADHIGSMQAVVEQYEIGQVYMPKKSHTSKTYENLLKSIKKKGLTIKAAKAGVEIPLDDTLSVSILGPTRNYDDLNNVSAVVRMIYGDVSFLFTGDMEETAETDLLQTGCPLSATVLKLGHHGSATSSSDAFLDAVSPVYAVFSLGKNNSYGHPHKETIQRMEKRGISCFRTDLQADIVAITDGKTISFNQNPLSNKELEVRYEIDH